MKFSSHSRNSNQSRSEESFFVDVDSGTILSIKDFKRGNTRGYQGAVQFEIPTFFDQISQSGIFNGPKEILNLAREVQSTFEERIFQKSITWQKFASKGNNYNNGPVDLVSIRQEILDYFS